MIMNRVPSVGRTDSTHMVEQLLYLVHDGDLSKFKTFVSANYEGLSWASAYHSRSGDTVLSLAARHGHLDLLRYLAEDCSLDLEQRNFDAKTALHESAQFGRTECVSYLLSRGVNVDCLKKADWTPLMLACTKSNLEVIRLLLKHGAKLSLKNKDGWNSFHIACREGHKEVVNCLLDEDSLQWDTSSKNSRTPLHTAVLHGCLEVTELLLNRCSYIPDMKDSCGTTPLMDAFRAGHVRTAQCLIHHHQAQVECEDVLGRRALHLAAQSGCTLSVLFLLDSHRVNVNVHSSISGVTPLHLAAKEGHHDMLTLLLSNGADIEARDNKGRTALHIASGSQHVECVQVLLQSGAHDSPDQSGNTACSLAVKLQIKDLLTLKDS